MAPGASLAIVSVKSNVEAHVAWALPLHVEFMLLLRYSRHRLEFVRNMMQESQDIQMMVSVNQPRFREDQLPVFASRLFQCVATIWLQSRHIAHWARSRILPQVLTVSIAALQGRNILSSRRRLSADM